MRLPMNMGNPYGVSPKPSSYLLHHNQVKFKEFLFLAENAVNWHSVCFIYQSKNHCLLVLA
jgi:hypothetical protein